MVANLAHRSWYSPPLGSHLTLMEETPTQETCSTNRAIQAKHETKGFMEQALA
jgi:hypothetical protein